MSRDNKGITINSEEIGSANEIIIKTQYYVDFTGWIHNFSKLSNLDQYTVVSKRAKLKNLVHRH